MLYSFQLAVLCVKKWAQKILLFQTTVTLNEGKNHKIHLFHLKACNFILKHVDSIESTHKLYKLISFNHAVSGEF